MNRSRRVLPPKIALIAIITMSALHGVVPLAIVVQAPFSYAGALFLGTGAAMIIMVATRVPGRGHADQAVYRIDRTDLPRPLWLGRSNPIRRG